MLYNLYRPKDFDGVYGQEDVLITLRKQAGTGRFSHAYLLAGHRGTGKTTIARILSTAVNCMNPSEKGPCHECDNCRSSKNSLDIIELDAASNNGVDKIKELISKTKYQPVKLPYKVFIIDEVHNLSLAAFDALLKTLEEPPSYCIFILCTTELHKIPVTIISRCELYSFHTIEAPLMKKKLEFVLNDQGATCEADALNLIVRHANGALRDALSILEQMMVSTDKNITTEAAKKRLGILDIDSMISITTAAFQYDTKAVLDHLEALIIKGKSPSLIVDTALSLLTDVITLKSTQNPSTVLHSKEYVDALLNLSNQVSFERLFWLCEQYCDLRTMIRGSVNPVMDIRLCLIKISNQELVSGDPASMAETIARLQKEIYILNRKLDAISTDNITVNIPAATSEPESSANDDFSNESANFSPFIAFCDSCLTEEEDEEFEELDVQDETLPDQNSPTKEPEKEGGLPTDRKEAETDETDSGKELFRVSASDLFKMLA